MSQPIVIQLIADTQRATSQIASFARGVGNALKAAAGAAAVVATVNALKDYAEKIKEVTEKYDELFEAQKKLNVQMAESERGAIKDFQDKVASVRDEFGAFKLRMEETALIISSALMPSVSAALGYMTLFVDKMGGGVGIALKLKEAIDKVAQAFVLIKAPIEVATRSLEGFLKGYWSKLFADSVVGAVTGNTPANAKLNAFKAGLNSAVKAGEAATDEISADLKEMQVESEKSLEEMAKKLNAFSAAIRTTQNNMPMIQASQTSSQSSSKQSDKPIDLAPPPLKPWERVRDLMVQLKNEYTDLGNIAVNVFGSVMMHATDALTNALMGMIDGTMTFRQAFSQMALSIIRDLIAMTVKAMVFAAISSIGSWGASAVVGAAAAIAAIAAVMAAVGGAFAEGGLVSGGRKLIQVNERGPEFVMSAEATRNLGAGFLSSLNEQGKQGGGSINVAPAPVNVAILNNREQTRQFMMSNAGRKIIFNTAKSQRLGLGIA